MRSANSSGMSWAIAPVTLALAAVTACADDDSTVAQARQPLRVECIEDADSAPDTSWVCPESLTVECNDPEGTSVALILSEPPEPQQCSEVMMSVSDDGPFEVGTHDIRITSDGDAGMGVCEATLTVVDTTAPVVTSKVVELWPPNHKWHSISATDCFAIEDACDAKVKATVLWATSDEPADDTGDGNTEPDMELAGCDEVQLRSERKGNGDGRVYRIGWRLTDDSGNSTESVCQVTVPHDRGKDAAADAGDSPVVEIRNELSCSHHNSASMR